MKWQGREESGNIEDRRGRSTGRMAVGGGIGTIVIVLVVWLLGGDPSKLLNMIPGGADTAQISTSAGEDQMEQFVAVVLKDTETVWGKVFEKSNMTYRQPKLVLFRDQVESACGLASSAVGDDKLQMKYQGRIVPDAFTHGTSAQRKEWFRKGWQTGDLNKGDTFKADI